MVHTPRVWGTETRRTKTWVQTYSLWTLSQKLVPRRWTTLCSGINSQPVSYKNYAFWYPNCGQGKITISIWGWKLSGLLKFHFRAMTFYCTFASLCTEYCSTTAITFISSAQLIGHLSVPFSALYPAISDSSAPHNTLWYRPHRVWQQIPNRIVHMSIFCLFR